MTRAKSRSGIVAIGLALTAIPALPAGDAGLSPPSQAACLPGDRGFLQASLRGALQAQLDWRGPQLTCQGGLRADGRGIRLSLSGPLAASGRRLRIIVGLPVPPGQSLQAPIPANVTVIIEGENRIFATRGERHCEVESLRQEALPVMATSTAVPAGGAGRPRQYRVAARGYCIDPVLALPAGGNGIVDKIYIDRFDFAALASFEPESIDATTTAR